jgi:RNA polymerase sigma-70 factor, ECF subfamily
VQTTRSTCEVVAECHDLYAAIRQLPRRQGECIVPHYLLDYRIADVAEILEITEGAVKAHLHHGRQKLKRALGEDGDAPEGGVA